LDKFKRFGECEREHSFVWSGGSKSVIQILLSFDGLKGPAAMRVDGRFLWEANSAMVAPVELETDG
jgi:hypothetical protein